MNLFKKKIAIVAHDAGSAELISSFLSNSNYNFSTAVSGPALKIFSKKFNNFINTTVNKVLKNSEILIVGTGWQTDFEYKALSLAKEKGLIAISFLDHWVNYKSRFIRKGVQVLPNEIWVSDKYAYQMSNDYFPSVKTKLIPNYYLKEQIDNIIPISEVKKNQLLYLLEPLRNNWGKANPGEFQSLDYFISKFSKLNLPDDTVIYLRPHPSEKNNKYNEWITNNSENYEIRLDSESDLNKSISRSKWVAGCESYALWVSYHTGRKVFCTLPPWAPVSRIPLKEQVFLKEIK